MRSLFFLALVFITMHSFSQGYKVKSFELNINDGSAFQAPLDSNGHPCGLIKVRTDSPDLTFDGNVVGTVENKMNEYWVFLANGSTSITIKHPNFMPQKLSMQDYGLDNVSSKATYILTLQELKYNKEKQGVEIIVKPENASLYVDDIFIDNMNSGGLYHLFLPKGNHICRIEQKGYRNVVQAITTGKEAQHLNVELESVMAELDISCKTTTAEIYVDGEKKGNGSWKGKVLAGKHIVEAKQTNYETFSQEIMIDEKEFKTMVAPQLKRSEGELYVETVPSKLPLIIDGVNVGDSPVNIKLSTGKHIVTCNAYGIIPNRIEVEVKANEKTSKKMDIKYKSDHELAECYQEAYEGSTEAIYELIYYLTEELDPPQYEEALFWKDRHPNKNNIYQDAAKEGYNLRWEYLFCKWGEIQKAREIYKEKEKEGEEPRELIWSLALMGDACYEIKKYDDAISFYKESLSKVNSGTSYENSDNESLFKSLSGELIEKIGDCFKEKGDKQQAVSYDQKAKNYYIKSGDTDQKEKVESKLKELGY